MFDKMMDVKPASVFTNDAGTKFGRLLIVVTYDLGTQIKDSCRLESVRKEKGFVSY